MAKEVWKHWLLWQKICFILAILLIFVLLYAFLVVITNRRQVKKYSTVLAHHDKERGEIIRAVEMKKKAAVPFGARAISVGVGIDGVYIPRNLPTTTPLDGSPAGTPPRSPRVRSDSSLSRTRANRMSCQSVAEEGEQTIAIPPNIYLGSRRHSHVSIGPDAGTSTRGRRPSSLSDAAKAGPSNPKAAISRPNRSATRLSSGPPTTFSAAAFDALEYHAKSSPRLADPPMGARRSASAGASHGRDVSQDRMSLAPTDDAEGSVNNNRNSDLDSIHSYRLSRAAEMGQLIPRAKRSRQNSNESHQPNFSIRRDTSVEPGIPTQLPDVLVDSLQAQNIQKTPTTIQAKEPENFTALPPMCPTSPPTQNEKRKRSSSQKSTTAGVPPEFITDSSHRNSTSRRVNSGFEVLPAGTFDAPASNPPTDNEQERDKKPKKLQKRRPSSASSRKSEFVASPSFEQLQQQQKSLVDEINEAKPAVNATNEPPKTRGRSSSFQEDL